MRVSKTLDASASSTMTLILVCLVSPAMLPQVLLYDVGPVATVIVCGLLSKGPLQLVHNRIACEVLTPLGAETLHLEGGPPLVIHLQ